MHVQRNATGDAASRLCRYGGNSGDGGAFVSVTVIFPFSADADLRRMLRARAERGGGRAVGGFGATGGVSAVGVRRLSGAVCFCETMKAETGAAVNSGAARPRRRLFAEDSIVYLSGCVFTTTAVVTPSGLMIRGGRRDGGGAMIDAPLATMSACIFSQT